MHPKIILHIDDDQDDRFLMLDAIRQVDQNVIFKEAPHGKMGIEYLQQAKASGGLPSLIFLDINMPVMDGKSTFQEIKKDGELSKIPIVVFSTSRQESEMNYWKTEQVPMIPKPSGFNDFMDCVKRLLTTYL